MFIDEMYLPIHSLIMLLHFLRLSTIVINGTNPITYASTN